MKARWSATAVSETIVHNTELNANKFTEKWKLKMDGDLDLIIISGTTARIGPWPPLTGFRDGLGMYDVGLSAPRSTCSSHPNSTTRDICWQSQQTSSGEADGTRLRNGR
jgi:hypothetical protein